MQNFYQAHRQDISLSFLGKTLITSPRWDIYVWTLPEETLSPSSKKFGSLFDGHSSSTSEVILSMDDETMSPLDEVFNSWVGLM